MKTEPRVFGQVADGTWHVVQRSYSGSGWITTECGHTVKVVALARETVPGAAPSPVNICKPCFSKGGPK